jgi:hypothetical protein
MGEWRYISTAFQNSYCYVTNPPPAALSQRKNHLFPLVKILDGPRSGLKIRELLASVVKLVIIISYIIFLVQIRLINNIGYTAVYGKMIMNDKENM